ncbi:MAG: N-acetylglucosamine-specific PTS transporter subunit IIBC [Marinisporobacter sp.]|jgi:PTS system N-acetylglucosamine-specific IIC component|nr:N-acetylglucosamine-specific PTS transporter subunit IIBC [Marinisporobacter sp.]
MNKIFGTLQKLGKALMLPIAMLPIAALLLRFGSADLLDIPFVKASGGAIFSNLGLLFGIGIAIGLAKGNHGAAGLAGAISYLILEAGAKTINGDIKMGVLSGIIAGIIAGNMYNKYNQVKLPEWLGFFGGKRFVPIVTGLASVAIAFVLGYVFPIVQAGIDKFGMWMIQSGKLGLFIYGVGNRMLIPVGLHHVLNSIVRMVFGTFTAPDGTVIVGDQLRFFAGDPTAGAYMAGAYLVMMFGLPASALAMYKTAKPNQKKAVGGMLFSVALTSFLTGITEPIEFLFMFTAPILFVIHGILMGLAYVVANSFGILHGFGFSAGFTDYIINMGLATNGWRIIPIGLVYGLIYYSIFVFVIKKTDAKTPGREDIEMTSEESSGEKEIVDLADKYLEALGGKANITELDSCITRLRLEIKDSAIISEEVLKSIGAKGVIRPTNNTMQVIVGTKAELVAEQMKALIK